MNRSAAPFPRLYAIIDPAQAGDRSPVELAAALLSAGVRLIQFRDKHASPRELYETAQLLAESVHQAKGRLIVNDRADIARAVGADGVHVGQEDLPIELAREFLAPGQWAGYSTHGLEQLREADRSTADYVAFGPVFPTASKANHAAVVGLEGVRQAREATRKPLVAIGGITLANARAVIDVGADSVAVIRGIMGAQDIGKRAEEFLEILNYK